MIQGSKALRKYISTTFKTVAWARAGTLVFYLAGPALPFLELGWGCPLGHPTRWEQISYLSTQFGGQHHQGARAVSRENTALKRPRSTPQLLQDKGGFSKVRVPSTVSPPTLARTPPRSAQGSELQLLQTQQSLVAQPTRLIY